MKNNVPPLIIVANEHAFAAFKHLEIEWPVHFFEDTTSALSFLQTTNIAEGMLPIALLNDRIRDVSGTEFLKQLRKNPAYEAMVVFILGQEVDPPEQVRAFENNPSGYIRKPTQSEDYIRIAKVLKNFWEICVFG